MDDFDQVRSAEQIAFDLAKALQFSIGDLSSYRKGIVPVGGCPTLLRKVVEPLVKSAAVTLLPLFLVAYYSSSSRHCSLSEGLLSVFGSIGHIQQLAETDGWFRTVLYVVSGLVLLGLGVYYATRIPLDLLGDILGKRVRMVEGRVSAREEETQVRGKRDEVIVYHFDMKDRTFDVPRPAFQALDSGGCYRVYYLPRSRALIAMEPSVLAKEAEEKERKREAQPVIEGLI
jgi:hypothetical protein